MKIKYTSGKDHLPSVMKSVIDYCLQPHKTELSEKVYASSGQHCTPDFAYREFMANKAVWQKTDGLCFRHYIQSFHPSEDITPEQANKIGLAFAEKAWTDYGVLVTTHIDRDHIHNHFIIDTVNVENGRKLHENRNNIENLRAINDEICEAHDLSTLPRYKPQPPSISTREYRAGVKRDSWKFRLRAAIKTAMETCVSRGQFIAVMESLGYGVRWQDNRKNITYTCFCEPEYKNGAYRKCNDDKLSDEKYRKENMENEFRIRQEILAGRDHGNEPSHRQIGDDSRRRIEEDQRRFDSNAEADKGSLSGEASLGIDSERPQGSGEKIDMDHERNLQRTGWESLRECCFRHQGTKNNERHTVRSSTGVHSGTLGLAFDSLYGLASLTEDSQDKTPEEIEAEERARIAGSNLGVLIGAGLLLAEALTADPEPDEEPDDGPTMTM